MVSGYYEFRQQTLLTDYIELANAGAAFFEMFSNYDVRNTTHCSNCVAKITGPVNCRNTINYWLSLSSVKTSPITPYQSSIGAFSFAKSHSYPFSEVAYSLLFLEQALSP